MVDTACSPATLDPGDLLTVFAGAVGVNVVGAAPAVLAGPDSPSVSPSLVVPSRLWVTFAALLNYRSLVLNRELARVGPQEPASAGLTR